MPKTINKFKVEVPNLSNILVEKSDPLWYDIDLREQQFDDQVIDEVKNYSERILKYAQIRLGATPNFKQLYQKKVSYLTEQAQIHDDLVSWYKNIYLPEKLSLKKLQSDKMKAIAS